MIKDIDKYFIANEQAAFKTKDGRLCLQSIEREGNIRVPEAIRQAALPPVPVKQIIMLVNEFVDSICNKSAAEAESSIILDNKEHIIFNNIILVKGCRWSLPKYDKFKRRYIYHDSKYDEIQSRFNLDYPDDIIWLKFTTDGYLGVVADSFDINFNYNNTSGKLLNKLVPAKKWDESFVLIIPVTPNMKTKGTRKNIETAVGEYLRANDVPIIDYYSHNNFNIGIQNSN